MQQDILIRNFLNKSLTGVSISRIFIKRKLDLVSIEVYLIKLGNLFSNSMVEDLTKKLSKILSKEFKCTVSSFNIIEITNVDTCSALVADSVRLQLEKRLPFRKVIKSAITKCLKSGVKGVKIQISGRLNGAEIARSEWIRQGQVPLHTLRANIDYCNSKALLTLTSILIIIFFFLNLKIFLFGKTVFGVLGIKVWLYLD